MVTAQEVVAIGIAGGASGYSILDATPIVAPEARLGFGLSEGEDLLLLSGIGETTRKFDTPSGQSSLPLHIWWLGVEYVRRLLSFGEHAALSGSLGLGLTTLGHDAVEIPLGVAGTTMLPANDETSGHFSAGLSISRDLWSPVSAVVGTSFRLLTPISRGETVYSVYGGINVEIY